MLCFAQTISVFRTGWSFARVGVGYPVSGRYGRSSFCKWRTGACLFQYNSRRGSFYARELRFKVILRF